MSLTKADIVKSIQARNGLLRKEAAEAVEIILKNIKVTLASGEDIMITGFGKFCVREKKERRGRNPATGVEMTITPRRILTFRCSGKLREKLNRE